MQDNTTSASESRITGTRVVQLGIVAVVAILAVAAFLLFSYLPDAGAFNDAVEEIFVVNDALTTTESIRILEILAQSGTTFSKVLASYRAIIFVLIVFATASVLVGAGVITISHEMQVGAILSTAMPMFALYTVFAQERGLGGAASLALLAATSCSFFTLSFFLWWLT